MCITPRLPSFSGKVPLSFLAEIFGNFRRNSVFASFRDFRRLPVKFRQGYLRQAIAAIFIIFTFYKPVFHAHLLPSAVFSVFLRHFHCFTFVAIPYRLSGSTVAYSDCYLIRLFTLLTFVFYFRCGFLFPGMAFFYYEYFSV